MKVLHINCNYIGNALHQKMIEHLSAAGVDSRVFVPTYDKSISVIEPNKNVCVCECFNRRDRVIFDYKQKKIRQAVQSEFEIGSFDCIHAYTLFTDGNCARYLSEKYNIPYVVAVRNTDVNDFFAKMIHLRGRGIRIMRGAAKIFFLSEMYRKQVFAKYVPKKYHDELFEKTEIIPNGIDDYWLENRFSQSQDKSFNNGIKLVYAGRIDRNKNISGTQSAMRILQEKGIKCSLTVVGKAKDLTEYKKIQADDSTVCLPDMPKDKLINIYRDGDIFVMPSVHESFGLVYAEAMSQGLPVIYTRGQGFDGQFDDGKVGYPVDCRNPEELANRIIEVSERYAKLSENCVLLSERFCWNDICKRYFNAYRETVK